MSRRRPLVIVPGPRRAATACPVQVWGWPLGCPWSARRRRARGQGACCFRVASSRRCDDECSSAFGRRDGRGSSQRHQSQARTVRALRRPASELSQGIAEPSAAARCIGKAAAQNRSNPAAELAIRLPNLQTARPRHDVAAASGSTLHSRRTLDSCAAADPRGLPKHIYRLPCRQHEHDVPNNVLRHGRRRRRRRAPAAGLAADVSATHGDAR